MKKSSALVIVALLVSFSAIMLFIAHRSSGNRGQIRVNPAFREYVQGFTSGVISTRSAIKIRLTEDFADTAALNMPLKKEYFGFNPGIKGKTYWSDSRTLEFLPDAPLPQDQEFTVDFFLSRLISVPDSLKTLTFRIRTMPQEISVAVDNHRAISRQDLTRERIEGALQTSDVTVDAAIEKTVRAIQEGKDLPISWTHDGKHKTHRFQIDSVIRNTSASLVKISWEGKPLGSKSAGDTSVVIPALGNFSILSVQSRYQSQRCVRVQFSDPLLPGQNLDGMIRSGRNADLRYQVDENLLWIYPPEGEEKNFSFALEPGIRSITRAELGQRFSKNMVLEDNRPDVRFVGDGVILPSSNGMKLPFEAVNLNAVDIRVVRIFSASILQFLQANELDGNSQLARVGRVVLKKTMPLTGVTDYNKWNRWMIDLSDLIRVEPGAIYSVVLRFKKEYSTGPCEESKTGSVNDMEITGDP